MRRTCLSCNFKLTIFVSKWWQTINMSMCSSMVFTVNGFVGFVDDGSTLGTPHTFTIKGNNTLVISLSIDCDVLMSGAWPPPAPSEWYVWMVRPLNAATVCSTYDDSFNVSVWMVTWMSCSSATLKLIIDSLNICCNVARRKYPMREINRGW